MEIKRAFFEELLVVEEMNGKIHVFEELKLDDVKREYEAIRDERLADSDRAIRARLEKVDEFGQPIANVPVSSQFKYDIRRPEARVENTVPPLCEAEKQATANLKKEISDSYFKGLRDAIDETTRVIRYGRGV